MKNGRYKVSFNVVLSDCNEEDGEEVAFDAVTEMVRDMLEEDELPELNFELLKEFDIEYETEEDELPELNFEVTK